jgi:hypothetical protein
VKVARDNLPRFLLVVCKKKKHVGTTVDWFYNGRD